MIDLKFLRDQPEAVRASQRARGEDESLVDAVLAADERRREAIGAFESARAEQKAASKELGPLMGRLKKAEKAGEDVSELEAEAAALRDKGAAMSARVKELEAVAEEAKGALDASIRRAGFSPLRLDLAQDVGFAASTVPLGISLTRAGDA